MFPIGSALTPHFAFGSLSQEVPVSIQRQITAQAVVFCLFTVQSLTAATPFNPNSIRRQAEQLGPGAHIRLRLANGEKMAGSIEAIQDGGLVVNGGKESTPKLIAYEQVAQLRLASRRYTAHGHPDVPAARRVVAALGVGQHIVVKESGAKSIHGHIQAIDEERFVLLPDDSTAPVTIAYSDVRHVEKNLSFGATIVLVVLIAAAVAVGAAVAATR
jgi:ribosome maturation factor RimP